MPVSRAPQPLCCARFARRTALPLAVGLGLLAGCATGPQPEQAGEPGRGEERARSLLAEDRPLAAARIYRDRAEQADAAASQRWRLRLVELLFAEGYTDLALAWHKRLDARGVPAAVQPRKRLVDARAALARRQGELALHRLPALSASMDADRRARLLDVRAEALALVGRFDRAVNTRVRRAALLREPAAQRANREAIGALLRRMPRAQLRALAATPDPPVLHGWAELGLALRRARLGEQPAAEAVRQWRERFGEHPAAAGFAARLRERVVAELAYPEQIALLLPLSGDLAGPASAIRDGLFGAYYAMDAGENRPEISVYDTGADGIAAGVAYDRAVDAGADFVIGPLEKSAVGKLGARPALEVPVLSLNYLVDGSLAPPLAFYQFGLLPEDEARQAARAGIRNRQDSAVALIPSGARGDRLLGAFRQRYRELEGTLLETARYDSDATDHARPIQRLLNLDASYARKRRLASTIGRGVQFEPRRRQDVSMVFMTATPRQARLLKPQLAFHRGGNLPTYTTSRVFTGTLDPEADWDMNGLFFTAMPWSLNNIETSQDPLHRAVTQQWPARHRNAARLFALGADAFTVVPFLEPLAAPGGGAVDGRTGRLSVDADNRLHRELRWARFVEGRPVPVQQPGARSEGDDRVGTDVRARAHDGS